MRFLFTEEGCDNMLDMRKIAILLIYQDGTYDYEEIGLDMFAYEKIGANALHILKN